MSVKFGENDGCEIFTEFYFRFLNNSEWRHIVGFNLGNFNDVLNLNLCEKIPNIWYIMIR